MTKIDEPNAADGMPMEIMASQSKQHRFWTDSKLTMGYSKYHHDAKYQALHEENKRLRDFIKENRVFEEELKQIKGLIKCSFTEAHASHLLANSDYRFQVGWLDCIDFFKDALMKEFTISDDNTFHVTNNTHVLLKEALDMLQSKDKTLKAFLDIILQHEAENKGLRLALGQISRMKCFPDNHSNMVTLTAARQIAQQALGDKRDE